MTAKEALSIVSKYAPCSHENHDTRLGNGKIWARCDDCGDTFQQENIGRAKKAANEFYEAIGVLNCLAK